MRPQTAIAARSSASACKGAGWITWVCASAWKGRSRGYGVCWEGREMEGAEMGGHRFQVLRLKGPGQARCLQCAGPKRLNGWGSWGVASAGGAEKARRRRRFVLGVCRGEGLGESRLWERGRLMLMLRVAEVK